MAFRSNDNPIVTLGGVERHLTCTQTHMKRTVRTKRYILRSKYNTRNKSPPNAIDCLVYVLIHQRVRREKKGTVRSRWMLILRGGKGNDPITSCNLTVYIFSVSLD
jgi:hypothetical protein